MGFIRDFIEAEKSEVPLATFATPATFGRRVATVATVASHNPQNLNVIDPPAFDPGVRQREADRENMRLARAGSTLRFCACGEFATCAWPDAQGRDVWKCLACQPADGEA